MTPDDAGTQHDGRLAVGGGVTPVQHYLLDFGTDEDEGWWSACCNCHWRSGPMPDAEDAADAYGDHRAAIAGALAALTPGATTDDEGA